MPTSPQSPSLPALALQVATCFAGTQLSTLCVRQRSTWLGASMRAVGLGSRSACEVGVPNSVPLLVRAGAKFVLRFSASWQGWLSTTRETVALSKLVGRPGVRATSEPGVYEYTIERDASIRISWGHFEVRISSELPPICIPRPSSSPLAHPLLAPIVLASVFILGLLALIPVLPTGEGSLSDIEQAAVTEHRQESARLVQAQIHKGQSVSRHNHGAQRTRPQERKVPRVATPPKTSNETQTAHPLEAATVATARRKARDAGIVGILARGLGSPEFTAYVASLTFDESRENGESYGEVAPDSLDESTGAWGHGIRKMGRGKTVKTGEYALGTARQAGADYERRVLASMTRRPKPPKHSKAASAIEKSGISYDVIRGQLGLRKRRFRRCFDEDAGRDLGAPGHLQLNLRISSEGEVIDASAQDVSAGAALSCIEKTLLSIHFPSPTNGKPVTINGFTLRI